MTEQRAKALAWQAWLDVAHAMGIHPQSLPRETIDRVQNVLAGSLYGMELETKNKCADAIKYFSREAPAEYVADAILNLK